MNKTFMDNRAVFDAVLWFRDGDNLIQFTGAGATETSVNTGKFQHKGFETSLSYAINHNWSVSMAGTYQDVDDEIEVPEAMLDFGVDYSTGPFGASLLARYGGGALSNTSGAKLGDYFVADLHLTYQVHKNVELFVDIDNLTDETYETTSDYPQVPVAAFFGIRGEIL